MTCQRKISRSVYRINYLELTSQLGNSATIFVVGTRILPDVADLVLERLPAFQECGSCRRITSLDTADKLLGALQRYWAFDDSVVISKSSGWKMNERCEYQLIPIMCTKQTALRAIEIDLLIILVIDHLGHDLLLRLLKGISFKTLISAFGILYCWSRACSPIVGC